MNTNIKNLPAGDYFMRILFSDTEVVKVIKRTAKTCTVQEVRVTDDPEWIKKREFHPGGFLGHTSNQREQTWLFKEVSGTPFVIRQTKKGWRCKYGDKFKPGAFKFYDFNF